MDAAGAQEGRIEGLVAFCMQSVRAEKLGSRVEKKSYRKKMQGYPHFFLFFFFYSIGSFRERSQVRGARKGKRAKC